MKFKVDLVLHGSPTVQFDWKHGNCYSLPNTSLNDASFLNTSLMSSDSDFILFWNQNRPVPSIEDVKTLCMRNLDLMHGSYWLDEKMEPRFLNYVKPIWLYNLQASIDVEFSSFRCTSNNTLIKTTVFKNNFIVANSYKSIDFYFLDLGYRLLNNGGVVRYTPILNATKKNINSNLPTIDNINFIQQFHGKKWCLYAKVRAFLSKDLMSSNLLFAKIKTDLPTFKSIERVYTKRENNATDTSISVLAPTLDRYWYINNTIKQLQNQTLRPLEILITDQTDSDKRQSVITEGLEVPVRYFIQEEKGQVIAWNKLISEAKGSYLLFLGDDADHIYPDFCKDLMQSLLDTNADMMASRVVEKGIAYGMVPKGIKMTETFPITLIKRDIVRSSGMYNMFFNKGIRADADLAIRCHLKGALMLINNNVEIFHHRAPSGGLRSHKQRKVTFYMSQNTIRNYTFQTETELYIAHKYFTKKQIKEESLRRKITLFTVKGNVLKKGLKFIYILLNFPFIHRKIRRNKIRALNQIQIER